MKRKACTGPSFDSGQQGRKATAPGAHRPLLDAGVLTARAFRNNSLLNLVVFILWVINKPKQSVGQHGALRVRVPCKNILLLLFDPSSISLEGSWTNFGEGVVPPKILPSLLVPMSFISLIAWVEPKGHVKYVTCPQGFLRSVTFMAIVK